MARARAQSARANIVLDCGANVGVFIRTSLRAGAEKIIAIEPAPDNIECLRRKFPAGDRLGRVVLVPKGVWDKEDFLDLLVDPDNQPADSFIIHRPGAKAVARVPLTTIDHLAAELQLPRVDYIKMDIEGAEVRALAGAKQTLARFHPRMALCTYHVDDHPRQVPIAAREGWNGYSVECGTCLYSDWKVRPEVPLLLLKSTSAFCRGPLADLSSGPGARPERGSRIWIPAPL